MLENFSKVGGGELPMHHGMTHNIEQDLESKSLFGHQLDNEKN